MAEAYTYLKFAHIVLAITAVGANITYGVLVSRASREPEHLAHVLKSVRTLDRALANPGYVLLAVTGVLMVLLGNIPWRTPWLEAALGLYVLAAVIGIAVFAPTLRSQIDELESNGRSERYLKLARKGNILGIIVTVDVLIIVFLMVVKPMF